MTSPWFKADVEDWAATRDALVAAGLEWPPGLMRLDLRWWADQKRMGRRSRPSSRELARQWGVTHWKARQTLKSGWEADAPHSGRTPATQAPHSRRTVDTDEHVVSGNEPHKPRTVAAQPPHENRPTRVSTEHRRQKTEKQDASHLPAPAEPDPQPSTDAPPASSEANALPLWEQLELPSPGKGCPAKLLTRDVLDVWAYWQRVHIESGRGKARVIGKDAVKAIHGALRWEPASADECPEGWTVKRLLCTVIAYAYRAPEGSPGVDWWRKPDRRGSDLNPETLLRLGRDPKLPRNACWAVAWSTSLRVLPGGKSSTPEPARHQHTAERLWEAWANPMLGRERCEAIAIPPDRWWDFVGVVREAGHPRDITSMHAIDRKQARKVFIERAIHWLESQGPEVTCG